MSCVQYYVSYVYRIMDLYWLCIIFILYPGPVLIMYHMYPVSWTCINCVSYISCWRTCIDYVSNVSGILDLYLLCIICILYPEPVSIMYDTYSVSLTCIDYVSCILSLYWLCFLYPVSWACIDNVSCILYPGPVLIMNWISNLGLVWIRLGWVKDQEDFEVFQNSLLKDLKPWFSLRRLWCVVLQYKYKFIFNGMKA